LTGSTGSAATITVGTTTTGPAGGSASVTNSGSSSAATFNFTIPTGPTGPASTVAGPPGPPGSPGTSGPPFLQNVTSGYTSGGRVFVTSAGGTAPTAINQGDVWLGI
jgi:hypothetical protein